MIEAGEDPRFIARRLVILASEDIGLADPTALPTAVAAAQAVQLIGMPEARLNLAQATIALAVAPKSNAVITAIDAAQRRRTRRQDRAGAAPPARRPLRRRQEARPRQGATPTATTSRSASPSSSTPPTWSPTPATTSPPRSAPRPRSRSAGSGSGASSAGWVKHAPTGSAGPGRAQRPAAILAAWHGRVTRRQPHERLPATGRRASGDCRSRAGPKDPGRTGVRPPPVAGATAGRHPDGLPPRGARARHPRPHRRVVRHRQRHPAARSSAARSPSTRAAPTA